VVSAVGKFMISFAQMSAFNNAAEDAVCSGALCNVTKRFCTYGAIILRKFYKDNVLGIFVNTGVKCKSAEWGLLR
jgi:hypothetical protein